MISGFKAAGFPPGSAAGMTMFEAAIPIDPAAGLGNSPFPACPISVIAAEARWQKPAQESFYSLHYVPGTTTPV